MLIRRISSLLIILAASAWLVDGSLAAEQTTWKAGTARSKITPKKPLWMAGYAARTHPSEGTLHDIWVKVLALEASDGYHGVIVTADILGFPKPSADNVSKDLQRRHNLERSQIMLTATHTHGGPAIRHTLQDCYPTNEKHRQDIEEYSEDFESTVVATVDKALAKMMPATLWAGEGNTDFAFNRRNNSEPKVPEMRRLGTPLKGPIDHSVPVLMVRTPGGDLRAVVFGYACHTTALAGYEFSGDLAGFAQINLEKSHPDTQAMFFQGCGSDQGCTPRRTVELCQKYGKMLSDTVEKVIAKPMRPLSPQLHTAIEFLELGFHEQPTMKELLETAEKRGYQARWAARLVKQLEQGKPFAKSYPAYPVQAWRLGANQLWITLGGEVAVNYSLLFKTKYGPQTWVAGYTNDVMAYIPSRKIWEGGGYQAGAFPVYGLPAKSWTPDIEALIAAAAERLVKKVK